MIVKQLKNPSEREVERIVELTVRAFSGTVPNAPFLGGDWTLHAEYCRSQTRATALEGELYVGVTESGLIVSTASWFPPGRSMFDSDAQKALGYNQFRTKLKAEAKEWENNIFAKIVVESVETLFTKEEIASRWWCYNLVTDPAYQRRGYATAVMKILADKADKLDNILGLIATTQENVNFYRGIGYRERGCVHVPAPTGDFDMHVMARDQSSKSFD
ncbi:hypothetical protein JR316_0002781 [Psilocybe cubensis]|uniref:N-acetyltransferase domain-containing protein n=2 Tax=Psilocybe cubensis TaxID=181762 RepID=A0A8H7Y9C9_PSICU|nr:hypothetical protein JR316_0002781 [Psilocybe cubensis]KAH9485866.1 hypothetical protein JR316_0002781 [Psilocybe cubensis]